MLFRSGAMGRCNAFRVVDAGCETNTDACICVCMIGMRRAKFLLSELETERRVEGLSGGSVRKDWESSGMGSGYGRREGMRYRGYG